MNKFKNPSVDWFNAENPKLIQSDPRVFTLEELLHVILGAEQVEESIISSLIQACNHDIRQVRHLSPQFFKELNLKQNDVDRLLAAIELSNRPITSLQGARTISSSADAFQLVRSKLSNLIHEEFWIMIMNRANKLISMQRISSGGVSGTVVDAKLVFLKLIQFSASSVIFVHNHPSGNLIPSQADIQLTNKLVQAGQTLDIVILDHLIVSDETYYSFADEGMLKETT